MVEISFAEACEQFSEIFDRAADDKERIIVTRQGKRVVAIVPIEDVEAIERIEDCIDRRALRRARAEMATKGTIPWEKVKGVEAIERIEDRIDLEEAAMARAEAKIKGTISLAEMKAKYGL